MSALEPLPPPSFPNELCDKAGAILLKAKIEAYWRERGAIVNVRIEPKGFTAAMRAARYDIRSDLVNALPRMRVVSPEQET